ncbi:MAG TPA: PilN domain-containing protein [Polyangia bacterium]
MIRINLSPQRRGRKIDASHRQLLAMGGGLLAALVGIVVVHLQATGTLDDLNNENRRIKDEVAALKAELGDYDKVKAQRENLLRQRKSIEALEAGRTGPVYLLRELSEILTPGKGPTFDRIAYEEALRRDPNVGFNASWDTHRVWLESYEENNKRVRIRAAGKSHDDAAEFMKRLGSSVFFNDVRFENSTQTAQTAHGAGSVRHVTFNLTAEVIY